MLLKGVFMETELNINPSLNMDSLAGAAKRDEGSKNSPINSSNRTLPVHAFKFEGGEIKLLDYSSVDEEMLVAHIDSSLTSDENKSFTSSLIAAHTTLHFKLEAVENIYISLLEIEACGKRKIGRITKTSSSDIRWPEAPVFRKSTGTWNKSSTPSSSIEDQIKATQVFEDLQSVLAKSVKQLHDLGVCEKQIGAMLPKSQVKSFIWTLSLKEALGVVELIDDETVVWEVRSLGLKLKQTINRLFPVISSECNR